MVAGLPAPLDPPGWVPKNECPPIGSGMLPQAVAHQQKYHTCNSKRKRNGLRPPSRSPSYVASTRQASAEGRASAGLQRESKSSDVRVNWLSGQRTNEHRPTLSYK